MATYFSDQFTATGAGQTTLPNPPLRISPNQGGGRMYKKKCLISDPSDVFAAADVLRFFTMKSGDCIHRLELSTLSVWTGGTLDIGLHKKGSASHDGVVIDADLFASAVDINAAALDRVNVLTEATTVTVEAYGRPLWFMADLGAGTYTADPMEEWDVTGTLGGTPAGAGTLLLECTYTSGS